jgi:outer membrane protein assembly factor BamB
MKRAAAALLALFVGGCAYMPEMPKPPSLGNSLPSWMPFSKDEKLRPMPLTQIEQKVAPKVLWQASVGKSGAYRFFPIVDVDKVVTAAVDGTVTTLDLATGRQSSRIDAGLKLAAGVGFAEGRVVVVSAKGEVLAYDNTGKELWRTPLAGEVLAPPALAAGTVVLRTSDGRVFGLNAADGKRRWVYQRASPVLTLRSEAGVIATRTEVVAGYPGGKLIALDIADGKLTWEATLAQPRGATELERISDVGGVPLIEGGRICAASYQGKIACFEIASSNLVWSREISSAHSIASDSRYFYASDVDGNVVALDRNSGANIWKQDKLLRRKLTAPVVVNGSVVVGDVEGYLHVISPEDGSMIGRFATDGTPVNAIVREGNGILVQTAGGSLYSILL